MSNGPFWCGECGVEITDGTICNECDPANGSAQVSYTFIGFIPDEQEAPSQQDAPAEAERPWWKLW
jgi:hypothetical protein